MVYLHFSQMSIFLIYPYLQGLLRSLNHEINREKKYGMSFFIQHIEDPSKSTRDSSDDSLVRL